MSLTSPVDSEPSDSIVEKAIGGDREAFTCLVELYHRRLFGFARSLLGNIEDAEDVVQESFIRAFRSIRQLDTRRAGFSTWIYTIVRNRCWSRLARRPVEAGGATDAAHVTTSTRPDDMAMQRERIQQLDATLAQLPAEQRMAFVLCDIQGLSLEQAAAIEQVPVGTLKSRRGRAAKKLRATLVGDPRPVAPARGPSTPAEGTS